MEETTLEVTIDKVLSNGNGSGTWGIYSCRPVNKEDLGHIKLSGYGNFTVVGSGAQMHDGQTVTIVVGEKTVNNGYTNYELLEVKPPELKTKEDQEAFLSTLVSESQLTAIKERFPEEKLVDLFRDGVIKQGDVKGLGKKRIEKIKERITKSVDAAQLIVLLEKYGFTSNRLDSILEHFGGDALAAHNAIVDNIYTLSEIKGWGFKTVDNIVQSQGISFSPTKRTHSAIIYSLEQEMGQGHTWTPYNILMSTVKDLTSDNTATIEEQLLDTDTFHVEGERVALVYVKEIEDEILHHLQRISKNAKTDNPIDIEQRIEAVELEQGFTFTEEQRNAIRNSHLFGITAVTGKAGTGKSATARGIAHTTKDKSYLAMALSGRAVDVLAEKGVKGATMHRAVGIGMPEPTVDTSALDILILDEFSMVNAYLYLELLRVVQNGQRLVLIGDIGQLPPIGYGDVARDIIHTGAFPITFLTHIHRQALDSGIIELAYEIDNMNQLTPYAIDKIEKQAFGVKGDAVLFSFPQTEEIHTTLGAILGQYKKKHVKTLDDLINLQVIAPMRKRGSLSVDNLNHSIQHMFNPPNSDKREITVGSRLLRTGDKVMLSGNSYEMELLDRDTLMPISGNTTDVFNGAIGFIRHILHVENKDRLSITVDFPREEGLVVFTKDELGKLDLAYASTVHKLQGSSAPTVIFVADMGSYILLSKQLGYVGVTRAETHFIFLVENSALHTMISTDASSQRRTFLKELLLEIKEDE